MEKKGQVIIFKDLLETQFNGDYDDMLSWLNEHNRLKEVIYIADGGKLFERIGGPYVVGEYGSGRIINLVYITMTTGVKGNGKGLIFINRDFVGKEVLNNDEDFEIKWYVNGQFIDDEEF